MSDPGKPRWIHDCEDCTFLGSFQEIAEGLHSTVDLYVCAHRRIVNTVIARHGDNPSENRSGLGIPRASLQEAERRALALGLTFPEWYAADRRESVVRAPASDLLPWEPGYESTDFRWLTSTMVGWYRAWKSVAEAFGSTSCRDRESGEVWQYMGSVDGRHEFRHRSYQGRSRNHYVPILPDDFDVQDGECYMTTVDCLGSDVYARC